MNPPKKMCFSGFHMSLPQAKRAGNLPLAKTRFRPFLFATGINQAGMTNYTAMVIDRTDAIEKNGKGEKPFCLFS